MPATSASYARLSAAYPGLRITAGAPRRGAGWTTAAELARGGRALADFVARGTEQAAYDYGRAPRPDVAATLALHRYLWPACLLFTVPWFLHRRVPRLPVADVSLHRGDGRMTVRTRSFSCLPGDPAARLPGARVVRSPAALREELRAALAEHAGPVLDAFRPLLRRGPHALWGMMTDEITEGLWYVGQLLGEEQRAVAELSALLPGGTAPYAGGAGFGDPDCLDGHGGYPDRAGHTDRAGGHTHGPERTGTSAAQAPRPASGGPAAPTTRPAGTVSDAPSSESSDVPSADNPSRRRLTCCLFYTISPSDTCATCPRRAAPARICRPASAA